MSRAPSWSGAATHSTAWATVVLALVTAFWVGGDRAAAANGDLNLVPGDGRITVVWSPPAGVTGTLKASAASGTTKVSCSSTNNSCALVGLTNGVTYDVTATVTDSSNKVLSSLSASATPFTSPGAPSLTSVTPQNARIAVSWSAPGSSGGSPITGYQATATSGSDSFTCSTTNTSCAVTGLTNGTTYSVSVVAINAAGRSPSSTAMSATPFTVPNPPTAVSGYLNSSDRLVVTWTSPAFDGGSAVTGFVVRYSADSGSTWTSLPPTSSLRLVVSGVSNSAAYVCDVAAVNAAGPGEFSISSSPSVPASAAPRRSSVGVVSGHAVANGHSTRTVVVTLRDATGRPVAGKRVTLGTTGSSSLLSGVTDARGHARFFVSSRHSGSVDYSTYDVTDREAIPPAVQVQFAAPVSPSTSTTSPSTTTTATATSTTRPSTTTSQAVPTTSIARPGTHARASVRIDFNGGAGLSLHRYRVSVHGHGFRPGSTLTITVHSAPTTLGVAHVNTSGSFRTVVVLPAHLPSGVHHLNVAAVLASGQRFVQPYPFTVLRGHIVGAIGVIPPGGFARYVQWSPRRHRSGTLAATAGLLVAMAAVAAGLAGVTRSRSGGGPGQLEDVELERLMDEGEQDEGEGQLRNATTRLDRFSRRYPRRLAALSPVVGRVVSDGDYLRAMLGLGWLVGCAGSVGLGIYVASTTGWYAVPPSLGLFLTVLALGVLDATFGYLAGLAFFASVVVTGHLSTTGLRAGFGLILVWFAVPLAAGAVATLRRVTTATVDSLFVRLSDVALGGLFGAWVALKMTAALPALANAELPIGRDADVVGLAALAFVAARILLETLAAARWPRRLALVTHDGELESGTTQMAISLVIQVALFLFISASVLGSSWALYVGAAVFFAPLVAWLFVDRIPKSRFVTRYQPRGLVKWSVIIAATLGLTKLLDHSGLSTATVESIAFVILPIPVLLSWTLELFEAPSDDAEPSSVDPQSSSGVVGGLAHRWRWRAAGTVLLGASLLLVLTQGIGR